MTRPRAALVITGSELARGRRSDHNGPFLARALSRAGIEPAELLIVGDEPVELERALREGLERELLVVTGGLGPTHDDRTVELLARAAGVELVLDRSLLAEIEERSRRLARRAGRPYAAFEAGVEKQATVPLGSSVIGLGGTAPALTLPAGGCVALALPGPPAELRELWPKALASPALGRLLAQATPRSLELLRFFGVGEPLVARALAEAGGEPDGVELTICASDGEVSVELLAEAGRETAASELAAELATALADHLFARSEASIEELVLARLLEQGLRLATAESCTGGGVAERLTSVRGSSRAFLGGIVAYSDELKRTQLGVSPEMLRSSGAVSAETARAMARGARSSLGADVTVSVTGIAGPGGGTPEKPVGLVYLCATGPAGELEERLLLAGDRETVRRRASVAALHLVRRLLEGRR